MVEQRTHMKSISLEELLEAGCHFGHQVTRANPKARDYIFEARDNIHIIDLEKTKEGLDQAASFVRNLAGKEGSTLLILGAKRQAQSIVREQVERAKKEGADGLFYVTNRWIGGILTNFQEVSKNFKRLKYLTDSLQNEYERSKYTKKEISLWDKERTKLLSFYEGIAEMPKTPSALFIIDTHLENLAVREALATSVPLVGITDTNADPTLVDYAIPANDDAVGSIQLITSHVIDAWIDGRKAKGVKEEKASEKKPASEETVKKEEGKGAGDEKKPVRKAGSSAATGEKKQAKKATKAAKPKKAKAEKTPAETTEE